MKTKRLFVVILAAILAMGVFVTLTACGPSGDDNTKSYQLTGAFDEDLGPLGQGMEFMLNLNTDGTAVLDRYMSGSYDASDAETNKNFKASYMSGTWKAAVKDEVDCLQIKLAVVDSSGATSNDVTAYAYEVAGSYTFDLTFPIVVGQAFTRSVTFTGNDTKVYADANAFIQAKKKTFVEPASVVKFTAEGSTVYVQDSGAVLFYAGYSKYAEGTYFKTDKTFGIIVKDEEVNMKIDGKKATFDYTYDMGGGYSTKYTYVCNDYSALKEIAAPDYKVYNGEMPSVDQDGKPTTTKYRIVLKNDTQCEYVYVAYNVSFACTYTLNETTKVITMTIVEAPKNEAMVGIWNGMKDIVWTLKDDFTMTGQKPAAS